jgi:hypothetical protein
MDEHVTAVTPVNLDAEKSINALNAMLRGEATASHTDAYGEDERTVARNLTKLVPVLQTFLGLAALRLPPLASAEAGGAGRPPPTTVDDREPGSTDERLAVTLAGRLLQARSHKLSLSLFPPSAARAADARAGPRHRALSLPRCCRSHACRRCRTPSPPHSRGRSMWPR